MTEKERRPCGDCKWCEFDKSLDEHAPGRLLPRYCYHEDAKWWDAIDGWVTALDTGLEGFVCKMVNPQGYCEHWESKAETDSE